jgi:hypothetical protein
VNHGTLPDKIPNIIAAHPWTTPVKNFKVHIHYQMFGPQFHVAFTDKAPITCQKSPTAFDAIKLHKQMLQE